MGRKTKLSESEILEAVLSLLRRDEPAARIARRYGISEQTLGRYRDSFLNGGKAALQGDQGSEKLVRELSKSLKERDQVIGELTIANRILKKKSEGLL